MNRHYDEAEQLLRSGTVDANTMAITHAILAVAQEFAGAGECDCSIGHAQPIVLPVVDADLTGDLL
jgi:hypothetical protein